MNLSCDLDSLQLHILHLQSLNIDALSEQDDHHLQQWKTHANSVLTNIQNCMVHKDPNSLTGGEVASIVAKTIPFNGDDFWTSQRLCATANEIMAKLPSPTAEVITLVLSQHIKPRFATTPHPRLNVSSGRRLSRPAGGPAAAQDFYEDQEWKMYPGTANILLWCIQHLNREDYERVWHLIIPPAMTLLDDYEASFKLKGAELVSVLLQHVAPDLLKRTGVDGLLASSLKAATAHLHTPLTPELLREALLTLLKLIALTTSPNSKARFDQLCAVLGDIIIGSVWVYASQDLETIRTSMVVLPNVLCELGVGSVRYLKNLILQILHNLTPLSFEHRSEPLQMASLHALEVTIEVCRPRISYWKDHIIEGLAKCWVSLSDANSVHVKNSIELRSALRRISAALALACPSVVNDDYKRLLERDEGMFSGLISIEHSTREEHLSIPGESNVR